MSFFIREIMQIDNAGICDVIKNVGKEFGAIGDGFGPSDPEVLSMSEHYSDELRSRYLIALVNDKIVGGCGIAPFNDSATVCELKKLFLLPEYRGKGIGRVLTEQCLEYARKKGFERCYLDTLKNMTSAIALYESLEFTFLDSPLEGTVHNGCDVWMLKRL